MIVSKFELMMATFRPIVFAMALMRSASIPITVWPSGAMNSFGAYCASLATFSVPFDLTLAGTVAAIAGSVVTDIGVEVALGAVLDDEVVLLLLPQPANASAASAGTAIRKTLLLVKSASKSFDRVRREPAG